MEFIDRHAIPSSGDIPDLKITRSSYTDAPPAHYTLKINSFSRLSDIAINPGNEKYESGEFESGDYKWKLLLYPNGDAKRNGNGHISLYLALVDDTDSKTNGSRVVDAIVRLFVFDHIQNKYLIFQDGENKRYHAVKTEHGFHQLLPLSTFKDSRNGYLVDDCCAFGAEVYVIKNTGQGQALSLVKDPQIGSFSWKIDKFSNLEDQYYSSQVFDVGGYKWQLRLNPKGDGEEKDKSLSLYIKLIDDAKGQGAYAESNLLVKDQVGGIHRERKVAKWFRKSPYNSWGHRNFIALSDVGDASKGFLVNDTLVVEAKLTLVSSVQEFV